jgi:hypothetical protein
MTNRFQQNADGAVVVIAGAQHYADTVANFETDFGQSVPALPSGAKERLYEPAVRHPLCADGNVIAGGALSWGFGDAAIAAIGSLLNAQAARAGAPPDPVIPTLSDEVDALRNAKLAFGYVDAITGKTWQCDPVSVGRWTAIAASAGLAMVMNVDPLPTFTLIAADNSQVTLSSAAAFDLFSARVMPWVSATVIYARNMKDAIAAENPPTDITAGWP